MTPADITLAVFTLCNGIRVIAYLPQITRVAKDRSGAHAISFATWGLFLLANVSAVAYALVNKNDWTMASMFLANSVGCAAIVLIGAWKRSRHRGRRPKPCGPYRLANKPGPGTAAGRDAAHPEEFGRAAGSAGALTQC